MRARVAFKLGDPTLQLRTPLLATGVFWRRPLFRGNELLPDTGDLQVQLAAAFARTGRFGLERQKRCQARDVCLELCAASLALGTSAATGRRCAPKPPAITISLAFGPKLDPRNHDREFCLGLELLFKCVIEFGLYVFRSAPLSSESAL